MKSLQVAWIVVIALTALLTSALWVMAQAAPPAQAPPVVTDSVDSTTAGTSDGGSADAGNAQASAVQAVGIWLTATVGTVQGECASTNTIQVRAGTTVYYCYTLRHTGVSGDEALTQHNVRTSRGVNRDLAGFTLNPGDVKTNLVGGFVFTDATQVDVTNFVTWTARPADSEPQVIATARARVDVVAPAITVANTVGTSNNTCSTQRTLLVPSNTTVYFCISLHNSGDITLTNHTLNDQQLNLVNNTFVYTLAPGATLNIIPTNLTQIIPSVNGTLLNRTITSVFNNTVSVTSATRNNQLTASGTSTASVGIGTTTIVFSKTVGTDPHVCSNTTSLQAQPGTRVYYCANIRNNGAVTLTHHRLVEAFLSIDVSFDYDLAPGQTLVVNNDFLAEHNLPIVFGPFELSPKFGTVINQPMNYTGTSDDGFSATGSAGTNQTYPNTPTFTPTDRPEPTNTNTPGPTLTPSNTPIPLTPTFTPSPTFTPVTPSPTPTRSYAISLLETPTPRGQIANVPAQQQPGQVPEQPTVDPNLPGQQAPSDQLPVQDPVIATATQIAVDATTTAVAATSTAIIAEATAAQLAVDNAQATALAETQFNGPESPLPTPTMFPQPSDSGELPVAPGFETPTETVTPLPTDTPPASEGGIPAVTSLPGAQVPGTQVTVLPPVETAVVGTETPVVILLVVTNTPAPGTEPGPESGTVLPEGQRPIVLPTPTATPDFVMAAARTFDVAVSTLGWLWFLVGSLVFFVTAGVMAGLFFRQSDANRYELPEPDYWLEEEPLADPRRAANADDRAEDEWPADLP